MDTKKLIDRAFWLGKQVQRAELTRDAARTTPVDREAQQKEIDYCRAELETLKVAPGKGGRP